MWTSLVANKDNEGMQSATKCNDSCNHMNSRDKLDSCQHERFGHYCVKTETTLPFAKKFNNFNVYKLGASFTETGFVSFHWISTFAAFGLFSLSCFWHLNRSLGA